MSNPPIKAAANGYTKTPFYLIQRNGNSKRYVVSLCDKISIRILLAGFINQSKEEIQVKIRDHDDSENPLEYAGTVEISKLHQLMTTYEEVIFHNGYHELMFRNPKTGDYIAFDEHGLIFIYTDQDYGQTLNDLQVAYKSDEKLIYEFDHLHYCMKDGREQLAALIQELKLKQE